MWTSLCFINEIQAENGAVMKMDLVSLHVTPEDTALN